MEHNEGPTGNGLSRLLQPDAGTMVEELPEIDTEETPRKRVRKKKVVRSASENQPDAPVKKKKTVKKAKKRVPIAPEERTLPDDVVSMVWSAVVFVARCLLGMFRGYLAVDAQHRTYRRFEIPSYLLALGVGATITGTLQLFQLPVYAIYSVGLPIIAISITWSTINSLTRRKG